MTKQEAEELLIQGHKLREKYKELLIKKNQLENYDIAIKKLETAIKSIINYRW